MIDNKQFKNIRSFKDIKLKKAKLRYDMLVAENNLMDDIESMAGYFSVTSMITKFNKGLNTALKTYSIITGVFSSKRKSRKKEEVETAK